MDQDTRKRRHDRHSVSLLMDHMVFAPKYRGKILTGDVAMITDKQNIKERISSSQRMVWRAYVGAELFPWKRWEWLGCGEQVY
jgi:REP element-mobilizing transposase RayT